MVEAGEFDAVLKSNYWKNEQYKLAEIRLNAMCPEIKPGQFFHILCPSIDYSRPFFRRPMSVYDFDECSSEISFLYKVSGVGTHALAALPNGARINVLGPLGVGFSLPPSRTAIVLLARGVGLATLAPLGRWARERGHAVTAILSARTPSLLMSAKEMRDNGVEVIAVTDIEGTSDVGNVSILLKHLHREGRMDALYTCGSNRLLQLARAVTHKFGIFGEVALEQQMACGLGMCFSCVRPFREGRSIVHRRVCCEGPVFPLQNAMSW